MWASAQVASPRILSRWGCRLCSQTSSNTQPSHLRTQEERAKRRQAQEESILSSDVNDDGVNWSDKAKVVYPFALKPGEKKDCTLPFPQAYSPEYVEYGWYQWWEKQGFFSPEYHSKQPHAVDKYFSFCIPPPNVTGTLHLGHALTVAIEDALARWQRMQGYKVLWVPGCDHAGIATQSVVERKLLREHGKSRLEYSREEFLKEVWRWKNEKGDGIYHQLKKLGASLDWSRACFTMDPGFVNAVTEAFVRLCDSGLIYRSEGLVNWSCALERKTSVWQDADNCSWLSAENGEVAVSTTRPETMLGDVAIAVHPDDPRYKDLHGKHCRHPFTGRLLPIVTDSMVDMTFGTGAVKLTPAHDHKDFLLSQRHGLPRLTVIGGDGTMTSLCGQWLEGVRRFDAREQVITALIERKMFRGTKENPMSLPICSRSGDVIELLLKKQWFMRCQEMANQAVRRLVYFQTDLVGSPDTSVSKEARERAALKFGVNPEAITLTQDTDVLDTWFSSGLFPFAMLGWPQQTEDLNQFYPNSILETGSDLIFFWVARMVMLGKELTGQLPFKKVVLFHSLVRDKHGRKMSKSLGNVIDPLDISGGVSLEKLQEKVMEGNLDAREQVLALEAQRKDFPKGIPECGTDALRFALCSYKAQGDDISLSVPNVLSCRHFCNKMWQTVRFTLRALSDAKFPTPLAETHPLSGMDRWICSRLYSTVQQCERGFQSYELHTVTSALHIFWLHNLCDIYLESIKALLKSKDTRERQVAVSVLYHCVSVSLTLLSPFMPFLTEELWQRLLPYSGSDRTVSSVCEEPYPKSSRLEHWYFPKEEEDFSLAQEVVRVTRLLKAQFQMTKAKPDVWAVCTADQTEILERFRSPICSLAQISALHLHCPEAGLVDSPPGKASAVGMVEHSLSLHLSTQNTGISERQRAFLNQRREKLASKLKQAHARFQTHTCIDKVPLKVREDMKNKIRTMEQEMKKIEEELASSEDMDEQ
ncbi:hypothetical protein DNTS_026363 [Danionella cerebrum]|uniref:Valine--tRNA ligase, mitochondrial n=1 Tax=Danionella cerebrum TaxID=2873325 RepID=A0A553N473_9TELE|nr:hypothetical protein DNTS_026363 [Danionella translucida]